MSDKYLLEVQNLKTYFDAGGCVVKAVDDMSFRIAAGETLGLVGESGCGKSVTAWSIMGLIPSPPGKIVSGKIFLEGRDLLGLSTSEMKKIRGNQISMIFQEPMTSLNPVFTVGDQVSEVFRRHRGLSRREARTEAVAVMKLVGIPEPNRRCNDYPHQMSGGMRQRVMIAMALACNPRIMIADEPTTALDVTIQAQILDLMNQLKEQTGTAILFITHDLGVIAEMAQQIAVMYAGNMVEAADVETLFDDPKHPYTLGLMHSNPALGRGRKQRRLNTIPGVVPSLHRLPDGCGFQDRCRLTIKECRRIPPPAIWIDQGHMVRCHRYR